MTPPVELADFLSNPTRYDFFVALRLLQRHLDMPPIGTALSPREERARFSQNVTLGFAPSAVADSSWDEARGRVSVGLSFTGLLGPNGPMPLHLTEYAMDRKRHSDDPTLGAFLDVFHHRIYTLLFRAWVLTEPVADCEQGEDARHAHYLRSLLGLGTIGDEAQGGVPASGPLYYGGWLAGLSRSPAGLGAILSDFLGVPVEVHCFQPMSMELPADSRCRLGESPATGLLGSTCIAGERIQVSHLKFRLRVGPLSLERYESLLPGGKAFSQVAEWVRTYLGDELFWEAQLLLRPEEVPECRLGEGARLGWTTWLGSPPRDRPISDLVVQSC